MNILGTDSFTPQAAIVHERVFYDLGNYVVLLKVLSTFSTKRERGRICTVKSKDQAKVNRIIQQDFCLSPPGIQLQSLSVASLYLVLWINMKRILISLKDYGFYNEKNSMTARNRLQFDIVLGNRLWNLFKEYIISPSFWIALD